MRKTFCIYLCLVVEKVSHCLFCLVFVFSICEFLFKAVIFKLFRFGVVLINNMAFEHSVLPLSWELICSSA